MALYTDINYYDVNYTYDDIFVDWGTSVIFIPKTVMVLVQSTPIEILSLDLNYLRLKLKDLEDDAEGMVFSATHSHNTEVNVGGVSLARVLTILDPYTITFEDGQYAVNLYGANSNVGDKVNVNQVSVRSANSAGLVTSQAIEYGEYGGGVTIDVINGFTGTIYPVGTNRRPVNNLTDALTIAEARGFNKVYIVGNLTIDSGDWAEGYDFYGGGHARTLVTVNDIANINGCSFFNMRLQGEMDNMNHAIDCIVLDMLSFDGMFHECGFMGTVVLGGTSQTTVVHGYAMMDGMMAPTFDLGGSGSAFAVRGFSGAFKIKNKTGTDLCSIDLDSGQLVIDSTVTAGELSIRGTGRITDNSTGTAHVDAEGVQSGTRTVRSVGYVTIESTGETGTNYPNGTEGHPVNNLADAITIATKENVHKIHVIDTVTSAGTEDLSNFEVFGLSGATSSVVLTAGTTTNHSKFTNIRVNGAFTAGNSNIMERCIVDDVTDFAGFCLTVFFRNSMTLSGIAAIKDATLTPDAVNHQAIIDFQGMPYGANFSEWGEGKVLVKNMVAGAYTHLAGTGGILVVDSTCTGGEVVNAGAIHLINNGTGMTVKHVDNAAQIWSSPTTDFSTQGTYGYNLHHAHHQQFSVYVDTEAGAGGDGSQSFPFNDLTNAIDYAETHNLTDLVILADITLDRQLKNFRITGIGNPTVNCNGQILTKSEFFHCNMQGSYTGSITVQEAVLLPNFTINGFFENCAIAGNLNVPAGGSAYVKNSTAFVTGFTPPAISIGGVGGTGKLDLMDYHGGIQITNCDNAANEVKLIVNNGGIVLAPTCTAGQIIMFGAANVIRNDNGSTVTDYTIQPTEQQLLQAGANQRRLTNEGLKTITVYEKDNVTVKKVFDYNTNGNGDIIEIIPQ